MKRALVFAAFILFCTSLSAQPYKPLKPVEIEENYVTKVKVTRCTSLSGEVYYMASHYMVQRYMTADLDVPANCSMIMPLVSNITEGMLAKLSVGGIDYYLTVDYISDDRFFIDLMQDHIRHIAVSGLQSITFLDYGSVVNVIEFHISEQELWRRTAEQLGKAAFIIL